ncbi:MAG: hypothetical protein IPL63_16770 [Saprospiraceae bacterium]|nr:hypothetical protein [Saprospiraceae bacterium]
MRTPIIFILFLFFIIRVEAQKEGRTIVEFSGMVFTEGEDGGPVPLPYTTVAVKGSSRGHILI